MYVIPEALLQDESTLVGRDMLEVAQKRASEYRPRDLGVDRVRSQRRYTRGIHVVTALVIVRVRVSARGIVIGMGGGVIRGVIIDGW